MIGGIITLIARSIGVDHNLDDKVSISKRLKSAIFEQMKFYKMQGGQMS